MKRKKPKATKPSKRSPRQPNPARSRKSKGIERAQTSDDTKMDKAIKALENASGALTEQELSEAKAWWAQIASQPVMINVRFERLVSELGLGNRKRRDAMIGFAGEIVDPLSRLKDAARLLCDLLLPLLSLLTPLRSVSRLGGPPPRAWLPSPEATAVVAAAHDKVKDAHAAILEIQEPLGLLRVMQDGLPKHSRAGGRRRDPRVSSEMMLAAMAPATLDRIPFEVRLQFVRSAIPKEQKADRFAHSRHRRRVRKA